MEALILKFKDVDLHATCAILLYWWANIDYPVPEIKFL